MHFQSSFGRRVFLKVLSFIAGGLPKRIKEKLNRICYLLSARRYPDCAVWNTNALKEIAKYKDLDIYVVAPMHSIRREGEKYDENGIHYYFFRTQDDWLWFFLWRRLSYRIFGRECAYKYNRRVINNYIREINPDIIHLIGAECPDFAQSILDYSGDAPIIAQLQALLHDPVVKNSFKYLWPKIPIENKVLKHVDYLATPVLHFKEVIIEKKLNPKAPIINTQLPLTEEVNNVKIEKEFDFVYFSNNINKAVDYALEAFAIAKKKHPEITLDIIGGCSDDYRPVFDGLLYKLKLEDSSITYEGRLPTHDDVLRQIRKARFALLPLKTDITSGTIREAMANGIPVITTITEGTPKLNEDSQCVLLSKPGDHQALAENMIKFLEDNHLSDELRQNALKKASAQIGNADIIGHWHYAYYKVLDHFKNATPLPDDLLT